MMQKKVDWEILFDSFINKNKNKPFAWGSWDCCKFANSLIKEISGEDLIPKKLKWTDEKTAMKAIKDYGGDLLTSIKKACIAKKVNQINPYFVTKGDLVVYEEESQLVGISDGMYILTPTDDCIGVKTNVTILGVWRIDG
tara:strand:- start:92 stop:511 length:420 start_codon:yes stop_codon:yes gene_type:complete